MVLYNLSITKNFKKLWYYKDIDLIFRLILLIDHITGYKQHFTSKVGKNLKSI